MTTNEIKSKKEPQNELDFGPDEEIPERIVARKDKKTEEKNKKIVPLFPRRSLFEYVFIDGNDYNFKSWNECFPHKNVSLRSLLTNSAWNEFFDIIERKPYYKGIERILSGFLEDTKSTIVPFPELVFNTLNILSPDKIKVVIIGQDPYINSIKINGKHIPQAMGLSFSVPLNYPKPPSLNNIYENLHHFKHIPEIPKGGCLAAWALQGCFMINAALTTFYSKSAAHRDVWKNFTNDLMCYINDKCENVVFLAWGKDAHMLCLNIDPTRHHIITSSHPSPLAYDKTYSGYEYGKNKTNRKQVTYPAFKSTDFFGKMNNYLVTNGKKEIFLDLIL